MYVCLFECMATKTQNAEWEYYISNEKIDRRVEVAGDLDLSFISL